MTEALRSALRERTESLRAIERATGVPHPSLIRFLAGKSLRLDIADRLATYFGIDVRPPRRSERTKGTKGE